MPWLTPILNQAFLASTWPLDGPQWLAWLVVALIPIMLIACLIAWRRG